MFCTNASVKYYGNGVQSDFSYPYEYFDTSDIKVLTWDNDSFSYKLNTLGIEYAFVNASTIRFTTPPPAPPDALPGEEFIHNVVLIRLTDVSDPMAIFTPGSSIKAQDLNDNFDQLRFGIEEVRCLVSNTEDLTDLSWQKSTNDTLYSYGVWLTNNNDFHVPTVKAVDQQINLVIDQFEEQLLLDAVTTPQQNSGLWISDDSRFATTGAIAARHDTALSDLAPIPSSFIQPGKFWVDTRNQRLSYWSQQGFWVNIASPIDLSNYVQEAPKDGNEYVRKDGQWVLQPMFEDAPQDGKNYVRKDGQWVEAPLGGGGPTGDIQFAFLNNNSIERGTTDQVTVQAVFIGIQPVNLTYKWIGYDSSTQTPSDAVQLSPFAIGDSIRGDSNYIPSNVNFITCEVTALFENGSTVVIRANTFCNVFTPISFP